MKQLRKIKEVKGSNLVIDFQLSSIWYSIDIENDCAMKKGHSSL
jgi:hypothetical protein